MDNSWKDKLRRGEGRKLITRGSSGNYDDNIKQVRYGSALSGSLEDLTKSTSGSLGDLESIEFLDLKLKTKDKFVPYADFKNPDDFVKFGSAERYYLDSISRIYNQYPYDGSNTEKQGWFLSSSYLDDYMFKNEYPKTTGYVSFSSTDWGSQQSSDSFWGTPNNKEYIYITGGPNKDPNDDIKSADSLANIYDPNENRESNLRIKPSSGNTIEFWLKKDSLVDSTLTKREVVFDLWSSEHLVGDPQHSRLRISLDTEDPATGWVVTYQSGSNGIYQQDIGINANITGSNWHHHAFTFTVSETTNKLQVQYFNDGQLNDGREYSVSGFTHSPDYNLVATIGSLGTNPVLENTQGIGSAKLSGSLDEFRYWKVKRSAKEIGNNYFTHVHGGSNKDTYNTDLGVYYKFNEGITGDNSTDATILDYSGRITNGKFYGYSTSTRSTGSAIDESVVDSIEDKDPIIYPHHPDVAALIEEKKKIGRYYDYSNNASIINSMPSWILQEESVEPDKRSLLVELTQIISSYFDSLYLQIRELPDLSTINYRDYESLTHASGSKPNPFSDRILSSYGFKTYDIFSNLSILEKFLQKNETTELEEDTTNVKNFIYKNIFNNLSHIYKTKGTETSFRNLIRCFGIGEEVLKLNTYASNYTFSFKENYKVLSSNNKAISFFGNSSGGGVVYQTRDSSNSTSNDYVEGLSQPRGNSNTFEVNLIAPAVIPANYADEFYEKSLRSSVFGIRRPASLNSGDYTTHGTDLCNLTLYVEKYNFRDPAGRFVLKSNITDIGEIKTDYIQDLFGDNLWNIVASIEPRGGDFSSTVTGSSNSYVLKLRGSNYATDTIEDSFVISSSIPQAAAENFLSSNKRFFVGAERTNLNGSLDYHSAVKVDSFRYYLSRLTDEEIKLHGINNQNFGQSTTKDPLLFNSSEQSVELRGPRSLALHWDFETITGSNNLGQFTAIDRTRSQEGFGIYDNIFSKTYLGKGDKFPANNKDFVVGVYTDSAKQSLPEYVFSSDMVKVVIPHEDHETPNKDGRPIRNMYAFEKSIYQTVSEEMLNFISSVTEFNNLIGEPVNKYRQNYKQLEKLKNLFFEFVDSEPDLERYLEYYKWLDTNMSLMLAQLQPATAKFRKKINNMVESHIFERNKYDHKYPTIDHKGSIPEAPLFGINEMLYDWQFGHAPTNSEHPITGNCLWWGERAERNETSSNNLANLILPTGSHLAVVDTQRENIRKAYTTKVSGSTYQLRNFPKVYNFSMKNVLDYHSGFNFKSYKNANLINQKLGAGSGLDITLSGSMITSTDRCSDIDTPDLKESVSGFATSNLVGEYTNADANTLFPFSIYSSSYSDAKGYMDYYQLHSVKDDIDITNIHIDSYRNDLSVPMQGTYAEEFQGGSAHRHVGIKEKPPEAVVKFGHDYIFGEFLTITNDSNQSIDFQALQGDPTLPPPSHVQNLHVANFGTSQVAAGFHSYPPFSFIIDNSRLGAYTGAILSANGASFTLVDSVGNHVLFKSDSSVSYTTTSLASLKTNCVTLRENNRRPFEVCGQSVVHPLKNYRIPMGSLTTGDHMATAIANAINAAYQAGDLNISATKTSLSRDRLKVTLRHFHTNGVEYVTDPKFTDGYVNPTSDLYANPFVTLNIEGVRSGVSKRGNLDSERLTAFHFFKAFEQWKDHTRGGGNLFGLIDVFTYLQPEWDPRYPNQVKLKGYGDAYTWTGEANLGHPDINFNINGTEYSDNRPTEIAKVFPEVEDYTFTFNGSTSISSYNTTDWDVEPFTAYQATTIGADRPEKFFIEIYDDPDVSGKQAIKLKEVPLGRQRAIWGRDTKVKSPVVFKNIKRRSPGNYKDHRELIPDLNSSLIKKQIRNELFAEYNFHQDESRIFARDIIDGDIRRPRPENRSAEVSKFSRLDYRNPGTYVNYLGLGTFLYNPYGSIQYDSLRVRNALTTLQSEHSAQFGLRSGSKPDGELGYEITTTMPHLPASLRPAVMPSIHKVQRNTYYDATRTDPQFDNFFVQRQIPRSDLQYKWIRDTTLETTGTFFGYENSNITIPFKTTASIPNRSLTFASGSEFGIAVQNATYSDKVKFNFLDVQSLSSADHSIFIKSFWLGARKDAVLGGEYYYSTTGSDGSQKSNAAAINNIYNEFVPNTVTSWDKRWKFIPLDTVGMNEMLVTSIDTGSNTISASWNKRDSFLSEIESVRIGSNAAGTRFFTSSIIYYDNTDFSFVEKNLGNSYEGKPPFESSANITYNFESESAGAIPAGFRGPFHSESTPGNGTIGVVAASSGPSNKIFAIKSSKKSANQVVDTPDGENTAYPYYNFIELTEGITFSRAKITFKFIAGHPSSVYNLEYPDANDDLFFQFKVASNVDAGSWLNGDDDSGGLNGTGDNSRYLDKYLATEYTDNSFHTVSYIIEAGQSAENPLYLRWISKSQTSVYLYDHWGIDDIVIEDLSSTMDVSTDYDNIDVHLHSYIKNKIAPYGWNSWTSTRHLNNPLVKYFKSNNIVSFIGNNNPKNYEDPSTLYSQDFVFLPNVNENSTKNSERINMENARNSLQSYRRRFKWSSSKLRGRESKTFAESAWLSNYNPILYRAAESDGRQPLIPLADSKANFLNKRLTYTNEDLLGDARTGVIISDFKIPLLKANQRSYLDMFFRDNEVPEYAFVKFNVFPHKSNTGRIETRSRERFVSSFWRDEHKHRVFELVDTFTRLSGAYNSEISEFGFYNKSAQSNSDTKNSFGVSTVDINYGLTSSAEAPLVKAHNNLANSFITGGYLQPESLNIKQSIWPLDGRSNIGVSISDRTTNLSPFVANSLFADDYVWSLKEVNNPLHTAYITGASEYSSGTPGQPGMEYSYRKGDDPNGSPLANSKHILNYLGLPMLSYTSPFPYPFVHKNKDKEDMYGFSLINTFFSGTLGSDSPLAGTTSRFKFSNNAEVLKSAIVNGASFSDTSLNSFTINSASLDTRSQRGEGELQNDYSIYHMGSSTLHITPPPASLYSRRVPQAIHPIELSKSATGNSDPINSFPNISYLRSSIGETPDIANNRGFQVLSGDAKWEAGAQSGLEPFYASYEKYRESYRGLEQEFSLVPEFKIDNYIKSIVSGEYGEDLISLVDELEQSQNNGLTLTGSTQHVDFNKTYSTSELTSAFGVVLDSIVDSNRAQRMTLRAKAVMKLLPYDGFYPALRTTKLGSIFGEDYLSPGFRKVGRRRMTDDKKAALQLKISSSLSPAIKPLFAPGVLYNSIKTGLAVDYPIFTNTGTGSLGAKTQFALTSSRNLGTASYDNGLGLSIIDNNSKLRLLGTSGSSDHIGHPDFLQEGITGAKYGSSITGAFFNNTEDDSIPRIKGSVYYRVPFESIYNPSILDSKLLYDNEPHPSASYCVAGYSHWKIMDFPYKFNSIQSGQFLKKWQTRARKNTSRFENYSLAVNNFLAESVDCFLSKGKLTTLRSAPSETWRDHLVNGRTYGMRIYLDNNSTMMYDRHSSFGPPVDSTENFGQDDTEDVEVLSSKSALTLTSSFHTMIPWQDTQLETAGGLGDIDKIYVSDVPYLTASSWVLKLGDENHVIEVYRDNNLSNYDVFGNYYNHNLVSYGNDLVNPASVILSTSRVTLGHTGVSLVSVANSTTHVLHAPTTGTIVFASGVDLQNVRNGDEVIIAAGTSDEWRATVTTVTVHSTTPSLTYTRTFRFPVAVGSTNIAFSTNSTVQILNALRGYYRDITKDDDGNTISAQSGFRHIGYTQGSETPIRRVGFKDNFTTVDSLMLDLELKVSQIIGRKRDLLWYNGNQLDRSRIRTWSPYLRTVFQIPHSLVHGFRQGERDTIFYATGSSDGYLRGYGDEAEKVRRTYLRDDAGGGALLINNTKMPNFFDGFRLSVEDRGIRKISVEGHLPDSDGYIHLNGRVNSYAGTWQASSIGDWITAESSTGNGTGYMLQVVGVTGSAPSFRLGNYANVSGQPRDTSGDGNYEIGDVITFRDPNSSAAIANVTVHQLKTATDTYQAELNVIPIDHTVYAPPYVFDEVDGPLDDGRSRVYIREEEPATLTTPLKLSTKHFLKSVESFINSKSSRFQISASFTDSYKKFESFGQDFSYNDLQLQIIQNTDTDLSQTYKLNDSYGPTRYALGPLHEEDRFGTNDGDLRFRGHAAATTVALPINNQHKFSFDPYVPPFLEPDESSPYIDYILDYSGGNIVDPGSMESVKSNLTVNYYNPSTKKNVSLSGTAKDAAMDLSATLATASLPDIRNPDSFPQDRRSEVLFIYPKWETPILDFSNSKQKVLKIIDTQDGVTEVPFGTKNSFKRLVEEEFTDVIPYDGSRPNEMYITSSKGMWHQYGNWNDGYTLRITDHPDHEHSLAAALGFNGAPGEVTRKTLGKPRGIERRDNKKISEALVVVPMIENIDGDLYTIPFFNERDALSGESFINIMADINNDGVIDIDRNKENFRLDPGIQSQIELMDKYILPPNFDFIKFPELETKVMFILPFEHTLDSEDVVRWWQNLPPKISNEAVISSSYATHTLHDSTSNFALGSRYTISAMNIFKAGFDNAAGFDWRAPCREEDLQPTNIISRRSVFSTSRGVNYEAMKLLSGVMPQFGPASNKDCKPPIPEIRSKIRSTFKKIRQRRKIIPLIPKFSYNSVANITKVSSNFGMFRPSKPSPTTRVPHRYQRPSPVPQRRASQPSPTTNRNRLVRASDVFDLLRRTAFDRFNSRRRNPFSRGPCLTSLHKIRWKVFKVKQKAKDSYYEKILDSFFPGNQQFSDSVYSQIFANQNIASNIGNLRGGNQISEKIREQRGYSYNWPYDFFSLIELIKVDSKLDMEDSGSESWGQDAQYRLSSDFIKVIEKHKLLMGDDDDIL